MICDAGKVFYDKTQHFVHSEAYHLNWLNHLPEWGKLLLNCRILNWPSVQSTRLKKNGITAHQCTGKTGLKILEYTGLSWKILENKICLEKYLKTLKGIEKSLNFTICKSIQHCFLEGINQYKIVVPLFGAAYMLHQRKGTIIIHRFSKSNIFSNGL